MQTAEELGAELEATRLELEKITAEAARNGENMRRAQARELRLLQADNMAALFREMTTGLRTNYNLQHVTVVIGDPSHDVRHLLLAAGTSAGEIEGLIVVESMTGVAPQYTGLRRPWFGPFAASDHQMIFPSAHDLQSVAIIPLRHRKNLFGSINFGSSNPSRFTPDLASDFLAHLGVIAAYCIENVVNRARLLRSGFTDVLTGWHNRRYLQVRMTEELARACRERTDLVCLMLDIDHFKRINDSWGHAAGDEVLRELAHRIDSQVRASDVAARYGGEEFVVLLPDTTTANAELLAKRIRTAISAMPFDLPGGKETTITASIGISSIAPQSKAKDLKTLGDSLIARADVALYKAKADGRDRVVVGDVVRE